MKNKCNAFNQKLSASVNHTKKLNSGKKLHTYQKGNLHLLAQLAFWWYTKVSFSKNNSMNVLTPLN